MTFVLRPFSKKTCGGPGRVHAAAIPGSCGVLTEALAGLGQSTYRCDLAPRHRGLHHCCGADWEVEWGGGIDASSKTAPAMAPSAVSWPAEHDVRAGSDPTPGPDVTIERVAS